MDPAEALIIDETAESLAAMLAAGTVNGAVTEAPAPRHSGKSAGSGLTQSLRPSVAPLCGGSPARRRGPNRQISRPARLFAVRPMAQLGAFGSAAIAQQAWADLSEFAMGTIWWANPM